MNHTVWFYRGTLLVVFTMQVPRMSVFEQSFPVVCLFLPKAVKGTSCAHDICRHTLHKPLQYFILKKSFSSILQMSVVQDVYTISLPVKRNLKILASSKVCRHYRVLSNILCEPFLRIHLILISLVAGKVSFTDSHHAEICKINSAY